MDFSSEHESLKEVLTPSIILAVHFFMMNSFFTQWTFDNTVTDNEVGNYSDRIMKLYT